MTKGSVKFENVTKSYGEFVALKPLSIDIAPGTLCTLLGPSGCGKTTTLRLIAGLESATAGRILIGGQDVTHLSATYRPVSMVFQSYALFPHMTVLENVAYGLSVKRVPKAEAKDRAETGLELVGLSGFGSRLPSELSGGATATRGRGPCDRFGAGGFASGRAAVQSGCQAAPACP